MLQITEYSFPVILASLGFWTDKIIELTRRAEFLQTQLDNHQELDKLISESNLIERRVELENVLMTKLESEYDALQKEYRAICKRLNQL